MGTFKVRQKTLAATSLQIGTGGTVASELIFGTTTGCVPAMNASSIGSASVAISGLNADATLFLSLYGSTSTGASSVAILSVYSVAANAASMYMMSTGGPTTASEMSFNYLALV